MSSFSSLMQQPPLAGLGAGRPGFMWQVGLYVVTVACSLRSWGSGADLWGSESDNRFEKPRIDDGLLEVVGVTGVVHMVS